MKMVYENIILYNILIINLIYQTIKSIYCYSIRLFEKKYIDIIFNIVKKGCNYGTVLTVIFPKTINPDNTVSF